MESQITENGLAFKTEIATDLPEINGDADKLKQLTINLISNAIKYNRPNGNILLATNADPDGIKIVVRDTGTGMLPEHVESLFEKFYRIPGSETKAKGTGLGLSIVKKIVEGHRGDIEVESEIGKGTTFTVFLPR